MFKQKPLLSLSFLVFLSACQSNYGVMRGLNTNNASKETQRALAQDASDEIASLYLPAKDKIEIIQNIKEPFGRYLSQNLRQKGFSVEEILEKNAKLSKKEKISLNYLMDGLGENHWRVQIISGANSYSREYEQLENPNGFLALGSWVKEEVNHGR